MQATLDTPNRALRRPLWFSFWFVFVTTPLTMIFGPYGSELILGYHNDMEIWVALSCLLSVIAASVIEGLLLGKLWSRTRRQFVWRTAVSILLFLLLNAAAAYYGLLTWALSHISFYFGASNGTSGH